MLTGIIDAIKKNAEYNQTRKALARLSRKELEDIGIIPGMIDEVVFDSVYGKKI
jgi:uncharacterized protein YjiS (DUF1127 family)